MADGSDTTAPRSLEEMLRDIAALEALAENWDEAARRGARARVEAVDALNAEAFRRLIHHLRAVPGMAEALRAAAADEVVYVVLRRHGILRPSLQERIEAALDSVRPMLASHGGDAELVSVEEGVAVVRFLGACDGCPASALSFHAGVKKAIQDAVPEIREVRQAKGLASGSNSGGGGVNFTSPFAAGLEEGWREALALEDLADGATRMIEIAGRALILSRFAERVSCFENACAHMGMAMDGGEIADGILTCPYHGFRYSLETGECLTAPEVQLQPVPVRVAGARIEVNLAS